MKHHKLIIDSRRAEQEKIRNAYEKPVSILTSLTTIPLLNVWRLLSARLPVVAYGNGPGRGANHRESYKTVLVVNFAAIHTSSMVILNLYLHIILDTELIEGIPAIRACPLLFGRPTRIHWASLRGS